MVEDDGFDHCRDLCDRDHPAAVVDLPHGIQDPAGFDRLSAKNSIRTIGGRLRQPVHHALAADAGIPGKPSAAADLVRTAGTLAQHGDRRAVESGAAVCELDGDRLRIDLPLGVLWDHCRLRVFAISGAAWLRTAILNPVY